MTWRLELPGAWGGCLDPAWLPTGGQEGWRRIFEGEDLAARVFPPVVPGCAGRSSPRLRLCWLVDGLPVTLGEFGSSDLAEGCAVAHRTGAAAQAYWAAPVAAVSAAPPGVRDQGWTPVVDTALRLVAFAAEESVATLCAAAATGHTGPDALSRRVLCKLGLVAHRMILEYRTRFRAAWTDMDTCGLSAAHDADAEARLTAMPRPTADGSGGPWRHALLLDGCAVEVSVHADLPAAAASVAAQRGVDEHSIRWPEPVAAARCTETRAVDHATTVAS